MNCYYGYYRNYVLEVYGNSLIKWNYGIPLPKKKEKNMFRTGKMPTLKYRSSKNYVSIPYVCRKLTKQSNQT